MDLDIAFREEVNLQAVGAMDPTGGICQIFTVPRCTPICRTNPEIRESKRVPLRQLDKQNLSMFTSNMKICAIDLSSITAPGCSSTLLRDAPAPRLLSRHLDASDVKYRTRPMT